MIMMEILCQNEINEFIKSRYACYYIDSTKIRDAEKDTY